MSKPKLEQLDAQIAELERRMEPDLERLSLLKRQRGSFVSAAAAGAATAAMQGVRNDYQPMATIDAPDVDPKVRRYRLFLEL